MIMMLLSVAILVADDTSTLLAKCSVKVTWSRRGEDATVTVTVKNGTKKILVDPSVRVTFFDANGEQVASDSKTYFVRLGKGASKRLEARIWSLVPPEAVKAEGKVEDARLE